MQKNEFLNRLLFLIRVPLIQTMFDEVKKCWIFYGTDASTDENCNQLETACKSNDENAVIKLFQSGDYDDIMLVAGHYVLSAVCENSDSLIVKIVWDKLDSLRSGNDFYGVASFRSFNSIENFEFISQKLKHGKNFNKFILKTFMWQVKSKNITVAKYMWKMYKRCLNLDDNTIMIMSESPEIFEYVFSEEYFPNLTRYLISYPKLFLAVARNPLAINSILCHDDAQHYANEYKNAPLVTKNKWRKEFGLPTSLAGIFAITIFLCDDFLLLSSMKSLTIQNIIQNRRRLIQVFEDHNYD